MGTSHEDLCTFLIYSLVLLRMGSVSGNNFVEKIKTHFLCSINFLKITLFMREFGGKSMGKLDKP
jgi:hypothetical protein